MTQSQETKIEWSQTDTSDLTRTFKPWKIATPKKLQHWKTYEIKIGSIQKANPSISGRPSSTAPSISKNAKNWPNKARWAKTKSITWYTQIRLCQLMKTRNIAKRYNNRCMILQASLMIAFQQSEVSFKWIRIPLANMSISPNSCNGRMRTRMASQLQTKRCSPQSSIRETIYWPPSQLATKGTSPPWKILKDKTWWRIWTRWAITCTQSSLRPRWRCRIPSKPQTSWRTRNNTTRTRPPRMRRTWIRQRIRTAPRRFNQHNSKSLRIMNSRMTNLRQGWIKRASTSNWCKGFKGRIPSLRVPISNRVVLNSWIRICNSYIRIMKARRAIKISGSFIRRATTWTASRMFNWQTWEILKLIGRSSFRHRCRPRITIRGKACC